MYVFSGFPPVASSKPVAFRLELGGVQDPVVLRARTRNKREELDFVISKKGVYDFSGSMS